MTKDPASTVSFALPDVAAGSVSVHAGALAWVGMRGIEMPVWVADADAAPVRCSARVDACVDLVDPAARGIHMSRLYLACDRRFGTAAISPSTLHDTLGEFLASHAGLSRSAWTRVRYAHLLRRPALASSNSGWRTYPVALSAWLDQHGFAVEAEVEVQYASTCPASAALARQAVQHRFTQDFGGVASSVADERIRLADVHAWLGTPAGMIATPHAQRSVAHLRLRLSAGSEFAMADWIDRVESALGTPVQTAVKREDEQAFALANGQNLLFCEDAARRIHAALGTDSRIAAFRVQVAHLESLHAHDAVAVTGKGRLDCTAPFA